jgi:hypothetical protein
MGVYKKKSFKRGLIVTGKVEDMATREIWDFYHYFLSLNLRISTIAKIKTYESHVHSDGSKEIYVECSALDSIGFVFKLNLYFTPDNDDEMVTIINDIAKLSYIYIEGKYTIKNDDLSLTIYNPTYSPLTDNMFEVEIENAFMLNTD